MTLSFSCQHCHRRFSAKDALAGRTVACPGCGRRIVVPAAGAARTPPANSSPPPGVADEEDEEEEVPPVKFATVAVEDEGLDMTPMVDVTFLLLIFFMVTAAFTLQKSIEIPPPDEKESAQQARTVEDLKEDNFIIVQIAKDNTIWVDDREAPSEQDLLIKLREARDALGGSGPMSLLVLADRECRYKTVVMALDAGNAVGVEDIRLASVDEEDF